MKKINEPSLQPGVRAFLESLAKSGGKPLNTLPPSEGRKLFIQLQSQAIEKLPVDRQDVTIEVGKKNILVSIIRPAGNKEILPIIVYIHGAGWVFGGLETHDRLVYEIAHGAQAAIIFVSYILAPEGQFPEAHEQGYAAAQWIHDNASKYSLDNSRMAIAGDSVGGLMATAIALMALERGGPKFIFQALFYPVTDANFDTESYLLYPKGYFLERDAMIWFWDQYVPDKEMRKNPIAAPLQASLEQLKNMPPAYIMVNEYDVLRDEGESYAHKLIDAGVPVVACRYLGLTHDSVMLHALAQVPAVRAVVAQANYMLRQAFLVK